VNKIHPVPKKIKPVEPEVIKYHGEVAANIVLKYLQGVSLIYDIDEQELIELVQMRLSEVSDGVT